ncbi:PQQ-binding-like beta-propeller repeat protein [Amycolatopsis taiwanensis]|nr:PQQ-binding-like beta-propeller repeat protein [Amycolatopsis taiwanensis]
MPPTGYGMSRKKRNKAPLIITIVVLLVLAVTGVTLKLTGVFGLGNNAPESSGVSSSGEAKELWSASAIDATGDTSGGWVVNDHVVAYVAENGVIGYDLATGKQLWQVSPPAGQQICELSPTADNGIGAIGLGVDSGHCDTAAAVDLAAGKLLWSAKLTLPDYFAGHERVLGGLSVAKGMVVVQDIETIFGYGARDGQRKWAAPRLTGDPDTVFDDCDSQYVLAQGEQTAQVLDCDRDGVKVATYDTVSGAMNWISQKVNRTSGAWWLLSVDPLVVVDATRGIYYVPGPNADPVGVLTTAEMQFPSSDYYYGSAAFDGTTMCTVDSKNQEVFGPNAQAELMLTCYDLTTGKTRWTHDFEAGAHARMIGMSDGKVWIDYTPPGADDDNQLLPFSPADGAVAPGPIFNADPIYGSHPLTMQFAPGNKIVRFGSPDEPVIVWSRG